jgi:hypothetical protein
MTAQNERTYGVAIDVITKDMDDDEDETITLYIGEYAEQAHVVFITSLANNDACIAEFDSLAKAEKMCHVLDKLIPFEDSSQAYVITIDKLVHVERKITRILR